MRPLMALFWLACAGCGHAEVGQPAAIVASASQRQPLQPQRFVSPYAYAWFTRAELHVAHGRYSEAVEAYRTATASGDLDAYLLSRMALALDSAERHAEALAVLDEAQDIDIASEAMWLARAKIARRHGDFDAALAAYERAEVAAPDSPDPPLGLADLLHEAGHPERAVAVIERFAHRSTVGGENAALARLQLALGDAEPVAIFEAVGLMLRVGPSRQDTLQRAASRLLEARRPLLAARIFERLPTGSGDQALRLETLLAAGRPGAAELLLSTHTADELGGGLAVAEAYLQVDRPEQALEEARALMALDARNHGATAVAGEALLQLGLPGQSAATLMAIPRKSLVYSRAGQALVRALEAGGLPDLAEELGDARESR